MKTPKRQYKTNFLEWGDEVRGLLSPEQKEHFSRWKRKNRVKQLKRTIARLTAEGRKFRELWRGEHLKEYYPEWEAFMILCRLKTPAEDAALDEKFEYWITLRKVGELALNAACLAAKAYGVAEAYAACHPEPAKSGQQTELPPTGGQQSCIAQNAENAKQANLPCAGAEQQTARKEQP